MAQSFYLATLVVVVTSFLPPLTDHLNQPFVIPPVCPFVGLWPQFEDQQDANFFSQHQLHHNSNKFYRPEPDNNQYGLFQRFNHYTYQPILCARVSSWYAIFLVLHGRLDT